MTSSKQNQDWREVENKLSLQMVPGGKNTLGLHKTKAHLKAWSLRESDKGLAVSFLALHCTTHPGTHLCWGKPLGLSSNPLVIFHAVFTVDHICFCLGWVLNIWFI